MTSWGLGDGDAIKLLMYVDGYAKLNCFITTQLLIGRVVEE